MKRLVTSVFTALNIALLSASCTLFSPAERTQLQSELPPAYSDLAGQSTPRQQWWEEFNDPQLNALVEEALGSNLTLKEGWARLKQAGALAVISNAALYPELLLESSASVGRQHTENSQTKTEDVEQYALGLLSNYELDLWGRIRSENEAALLSVSATREDLNAAAISVAAAVTERWVRILSQRMQKHLLEQQLAANVTLLELIELRFRKSLASALDVFQQRQVVERSRSQIPLIEQSEHLLLNELALLLGKSPYTVPTIERETLQIPSDIPEAGLPAQLLTARPDVRAAFLRLEQADWQVAAARADRLPSIRLTARAAYQSGDLDLLFNNWLLNLAANLTAPLLDGRRRTAEVERALAKVDENLAAYRRTILTAIKEVEDALISEDKLRQHINSLDAQLDAAQNALTEARARYYKGLNDYLPVLTEMLTVQNLERDLIKRKTDLIIARVNLYRALGGTWTDDLTP